jgi:hypothetical protein
MTPVGARDGPPEISSSGVGDEDYLNILGQKGAWHAWACAELPGMVLRLPRGEGMGHSDEYLVLAARIRDFEGPTPPVGGEQKSAESVVSTAWFLDSTLALFALSRIVADYDVRVARMRDRLGEVRLGRMRKAVRQMQEIERDLAMLARDVRPLLGGIASAPARVWEVELYTFLPFDEQSDGSEPVFARMSTILVEQSTRLLALLNETSQTMRTISDLVAASANLAAARMARRLQVVSIAIAMSATILAVLVLQPDPLQRLQAAWTALRAAFR